MLHISSPNLQTYLDCVRIGLDILSVPCCIALDTYVRQYLHELMFDKVLSLMDHRHVTFVVAHLIVL